MRLHWMSHKVRFIGYKKTQIINCLLQNISSWIVISVHKAKILYWGGGAWGGGSTSYLEFTKRRWESRLRWTDHPDYWNLSFSINSLDKFQFHFCLQTWSLRAWVNILSIFVEYLKNTNNFSSPKDQKLSFQCWTFLICSQFSSNSNVQAGISSSASWLYFSVALHPEVYLNWISSHSTVKSDNLYSLWIFF